MEALKAEPTYLNLLCVWSVLWDDTPIGDWHGGSWPSGLFAVSQVCRQPSVKSMRSRHWENIKPLSKRIAAWRRAAEANSARHRSRSEHLSSDVHHPQPEVEQTPIRDIDCSQKLSGCKPHGVLNAASMEVHLLPLHVLRLSLSVHWHVWWLRN